MTDSSKHIVELNVEQAVGHRYSAASQAAEPALCCPVQYDPKYLKLLPEELIERDYGCGDPSRYVEHGSVVLDLGCGGGKICYIASQIVGAEGRVLGVDMNDDMLALARKYQGEIAQRLGWDIVSLYKGRIPDLALDMERFEAYLRENPVSSSADWLRAQQHADELRRSDPMIASESVDVVLSNCVLNLVRPEDRRQLFAEIFRVLRRGGRAVISDIVCDEPVPQHLKEDPELWSGCISGAFLEDEFIEEFARAGFYGMEIMSRQEEPWATVEGIEFRSVTMRAFKGKEGPCLDHHQAVIYKGPWKQVVDDDGHTLRRGLRTAVCEKLFRLYTGPPYEDDILPIAPYQEVNPALALTFDCQRSAVRHPRETKGLDYDKNELPSSECCSDDGCC